ncbi:non-heme ferritin [bacterium]|nr:MAG: non-heme ferritin [bacterium]
MLEPALVEKLNAQINLEFYSSNLYLQMSAWCEAKSLPGAAAFLKSHADEEMQHMQRLFQYVIETGAMPRIGAIEDPQADFGSVEDVFAATFAHEQNVTKSINALADAAFTSKDYSTFNFLQWYVSEQHEEESLFAGILDRIRLIGIDGRGLYHIDNELGGLASKASAGGTAKA